MPISPEELESLRHDLAAKESAEALAQAAAERTAEVIDRVKSKTAEERVDIFWSRYPEERPADASGWGLEEKAAEGDRLNDKAEEEHRAAMLALEQATQAATAARNLVAENEGRV